VAARPAVPALDAQPVDAPALRLHDLGTLGIEVGGVDSPIRGRKPARILATLLVNTNARVSIDTLVDAVWGEQASASALGTLETHIWRLRKLLEPQRRRGTEPAYLVNDSLGYRLVVNPDNADSLRFAQLSEQGDRLLASGEPDRALRRYELALTLWRGRPFESVADEEWAMPSVARLEGLHAQVHEQRIEALLRTGAADQAARELEVVIARLPYRERLWSQLMLGLYQAGRVEEALAAYRRAREILLDSLGLEPGPQLRELQQQILDRDPRLAPIPARAVAPQARQSDEAEVDGQVDAHRPSHTSEPAEQPSDAGREVHLPSRLSALVGRSAELERIGRLVRSSQLVTLVGPAGSGKTRLAIEVARAATSLAPDGLWFIDLAAVDDPAMVVDTVMSTIGIEQPLVGTIAAALGSYARDRQILLLIDNCEHLLAGVHRLFDVLLSKDSQCRVLATSREPVGLDGEVLWTLAPLAVRENPQPGEAASPAAELFLARARSADPLFEATDEALADIEKICAAVDGLPLAVELAAGRIRSASLAEVHRQVSTELAGLGRAGYAPTPHHRTVELSIEWSARLLSDAERAAHARLSVLPGFFTVDAARAVIAGPSARTEDVPDLLTQLVHRSLLAVVRGGADTATRFRQLATVRAHASHALATAGETGSVLSCRTEWVAELVAARPAPEAEDLAGWHEQIERNHDTVAATLQHTLHDRPDPLGVRLAGQLESYWLLQARVPEGERWLQAALAQQDAPIADLATVELTLALLLAWRSRPDQVLPLVRRALRTTDTMDRRLLARILAATAWWMSLRDDSGSDFIDAEVRSLIDDDPVIEAWADLLTAKTAASSVGPIVTGARAVELIDRSESLGNVHAAWLAARLAARSAMIAADPAAGRPLLQRVIALHRRLGGQLTADLVEWEAAFTSLAGDYHRAAELFGQASTLAFRAGTRWPLATYGEREFARVRRELPDAQFESAWQHGAAVARSTR
jgi:predicted ATPase/DNA-binding SARP family transcriptional activator